MKFKLEITCDNAAFGKDPSREVIRILEDVQHRLNVNIKGDKCWDFNGNVVGKWSITGKQPK